MAFLAHSIPWNTLSELFEYSKDPQQGSQHPEIFAKSKPGQDKELEYFVSGFQAAVREHSVIERKRYRPANEYVERAQVWTESARDDDTAGETSNVKDPADEKVTDQNALKKRNAELHEFVSNTWSTSSPERRHIFPSDFATTYIPYVAITSGASYGRQGLVEEFSHVEKWIDFVKRNAHYSTCTNDERNILWLNRKSCSDILRLLVIDAATTSEAERRTHNLETIFLLAHHPDVGISPFLSDGMSCCNVEVGLKSLVQKSTLAFLYLNLLWTYIDGNPSSSLLQPSEHMEQDESASFRTERFTSLLPRPAYMNTKSFKSLLEEVLKEHGHVIEHVFFNPLFAPYASGRRSRFLVLESIPQSEESKTDKDDKRRERDIFKDLPALKEALKGMWKMLVYCDMLFEDAGESINWEWVIIDQFDALFPGKNGLERVIGMSRVEYELKKTTHGGSGFFVKNRD
jgi:hypothetical protein